jgi:hypothetical protein
MMRTFAALALCVLAACSAPVAPTVIVEHPIGNIAEYFWTPSGAATFADTNAAPQNSLTFSGTPSSVIATDATHATLNCIVSSDSIYVTGFGRGSLIDTSRGYFSALDTEVWIQPKVHAAIIGDGPDIYIANDSGMFVEPQNDTVFHRWGLDGVSDITALDRREFAPDVFAATGSGVIWARDPAGAAWQKLPALPVSGAIETIWIGPDSVLYAAVHGAPGFYQYSDRSSTWSHPQYLSTKTITAFGGPFYASGTLYLLVGCSDGTVGFYRSDAPTLSLIQIPSGPKVNALEWKPSTSQFLVATDGGIYQCTTDASSPILLINVKNVTAIALVNTSSSLYYVASGQVYLYGNTIPSQPPNPILQIYGHTNLFVVTDSEIVTPTTSGGDAWQRVRRTPIGWWPYAPGGLNLLQKDLFSKDSSWRAGTLVDDHHHSYHITAHVLGRLDSLQIQFHGQTTSRTYGDILIIDYSYQSDALHEWIVYYQRGRGPIMFDTRVTDPISHSSDLITRRAIKETL